MAFRFPMGTEPAFDQQVRTNKIRNRQPIVEDLVDKIVSGHYPVEGLLPTEMEIAERYGSSRTVVREVFQTLAALCLIETKPRVGARVLKSKFWDRLHPIILDAELKHGLDASLYEPLIEARALIEPEVAAMAALRASPRHIEVIRAAYGGLEALKPDPTPQERIQADIRFHRAILNACGNWVFQKFDTLFDAAITARMNLALRSQESDPPFALKKHKRILDAISDRNPGEARRATLSVLALSKPVYADYFDGEGP